ncbi:ATP-binding protein [Streptomyces armeniacus]|uniref:ATP-binding protein n=1 Tax=Streptomyces armeniacus TaxID=83291 RepID=A0A345XI50_9ACTN|nr:ATP-binding protein [Streptomyces armeniacus]
MKGGVAVALPRGTTVLALPQEDGADTELLWAGFELPAHDAAVVDARRRVHRQLRRWAFPPEVCDTAQLLVSELFTNAVLHSDSSRISCLMHGGGTRLRIEIHDQGSESAVPLPCWATPDDEHGRGLLLVDTLSEEWGVDRTGEEGGRVVWVELGPIST